MYLLQLFSDNPLLRSLQVGMVVVALLTVFFVLFTTRDVLLRSQSLPFQLFSVLIAAALPLLGFLLYLVIRPARTIRERETEEMIRAIHASLAAKAESAPEPQKKPKKAKNAEAEEEGNV